MFKHKKHEKHTYGVIGVGRFGFSLVRELATSGAELLVLDRNEDTIRLVRDITENAFIVHSLDKKTLADTGIQNCDVVIVCIGEQVDTSILTTLNLKSLGVPTVIAKANSQEHGEVLEKLGAEVVYPERDMAVRLASRLQTSSVLDIVRLSEKINILKLNLPEVFVGKTVLEANLRNLFELNIIAIERGRTLVESIRPNYVLESSDILYLSGSKEGLLKLSEWLEEQS